MANTYLTYTPSAGDATARQKWTWSAWIKRSKLGSSQFLFCGGDGGSYPTQIYISSGDVFAVYDTGENATAATNAKLIDTNAWYHLVARFDATQGTAADKMKLYINGVQQSLGTSWSQSNTNPSSMGKGETHVLGRRSSGDNFDGLMSHVHFCLGYSYGPDSFGSTDSTTGEWKINTSPSVSYGSQGFWWLKDSIATTDHSPNSNTFTVSGGTLTKTEDCPSNVFAVINRHSLNHSDLAHLEYGNTQVAGSTSGSVKWYGASTLAFTKGKFYCEVLNKTTSNASLSVGISMNPSRNQRENHAVGARNSDIGTENYSGNIVINNSNVSVGYGSTWTANNDICMLAVDADNNKFYVGKNGTWANSDNPSNGTGGYDMSSVANHAESSSFYHFAFGSTSGSYMNSFSVNFGNGYFGITAVTSNSGNGYAAEGNLGKFQYQPPTGFTALCTKGLNE